MLAVECDTTVTALVAYLLVRMPRALKARAFSRRRPEILPLRDARSGRRPISRIRREYPRSPTPG